MPADGVRRQRRPHRLDILYEGQRWHGLFQGHNIDSANGGGLYEGAGSQMHRGCAEGSQAEPVWVHNVPTDAPRSID
jgi:hypothetical protein